MLELLGQSCTCVFVEHHSLGSDTLSLLVKWSFQERAAWTKFVVEKPPVFKKVLWNAQGSTVKRVNNACSSYMSPFVCIKSQHLSFFFSLSTIDICWDEKKGLIVKILKHNKMHFHGIGSLGGFSHRVAMCGCLCVCDNSKYPLLEVVETSGQRAYR